MKKSALSLFFVLICVTCVFAEQTYLPFPVKIGGQEARFESEDSLVATLAAPVGADAEVTAGFGTGSIIVNVTEADDDGNPVPGKPITILVLKNGTGFLSENWNKELLAPARYVAVFIAGGKTAQVVFTVK